MKKRAGFWKFNNSLLLEENFASNLEEFIKETKTKLNSEEILDPQLKWEFFKYEICKFFIKCSECRVKEMRKSKADLETKLKLLGSSLYNDACVFEYNQCKKQQKQPPSGVPRKRCSENMQEMYRRTPMPKCDFNKVAVALSHGCSVNLHHLVAASETT